MTTGGVTSDQVEQVEQELRRALDRALERVRALAPAEVEVQTAGPLPVVRANHMAVRQVLLNLVAGAATRAGGETVTVTIRGLERVRRLVEHQGGTVEVEQAPEGGRLVRFTLPARS